MNKERTFKDLLALCVKRWKMLIIGMIIGAFLMGYMQYNMQMKLKNDPENSEEAIEKRFQQAMSEYNDQIKKMDDEIAADERIIQTNQEYMDNSLLMLIDPFNKYTTVIDVAIEITDDEVFTQNYGYSTTPVEYIVSKVQNQYMAAYGNIDISRLVGLQQIHENVLPKYWNEVLKVETKNGGLLEITAYGPTDEESRAIVNAIYDYFKSKTEVICQSAYEHSFVIVSDITRVEIDSELEEMQNSKKGAVNSARRDIEVQEQNKIDLPLPEREHGFDEGAMKSAIKKFAVIGIGVGLIAAMFIVMLYAISVRQVITSEEIVNNCKVVFLGTLNKSTYRRKMICPRLSDLISGERVWRTQEGAIDYIIESTNALLPGDNVLISSSRSLNENDDGIIVLKERLEKQEKKVTLLLDAAHNAKFNAAVKMADTVILLERPIKSKMNEIDAIVESCNRMGKADVGFVLMTK